VTAGQLRLAGPGDAAALLRLKQHLDRETAFMLLEPDERDPSVQALADELGAMARSGNSAVIVADSDGELVGYVELTGGSFRRNRTTAYLVIGVLAEASGRGIGSGLLAEARGWAVAHGVHRLELTVMAHNQRAVGLYERAGFSVEGRRSQCLVIDGRFIDELYMAMILVRPAPRADNEAIEGGTDDLPQPAAGRRDSGASAHELRPGRGPGG
jgi:RimJ/RimL family protein N-acetyltransferase